MTHRLLIDSSNKNCPPRHVLCSHLPWCRHWVCPLSASWAPPKLVGNGWDSNHPPTSMVDQQCPTQRTCTKNNLRPTSSNKIWMKKQLRILSVVWTFCCAWCQKLQKPVSCKLWNNYTGPECLGFQTNKTWKLTTRKMWATKETILLSIILVG